MNFFPSVAIKRRIGSLDRDHMSHAIFDILEWAEAVSFERKTCRPFANKLAKKALRFRREHQREQFLVLTAAKRCSFYPI